MCAVARYYDISSKKQIVETFVSSKAEAAIMERVVTFPTRLVVFGQSQCTVPVGQSEQTALVERRGFVENDSFERGGA